MPVASIAVDELRLDPDLRRFDFLSLRLHGDGFAFERLRLEPAAVAHVQREPGIARDRCREIDDDGVLTDHAEVEQSSELRREYATHRKRFGKAKRQRAQGERPD